MCHPTKSDLHEKRRVTFGPTVQVHYFRIDISDNPASTSGPPIQLSWEILDTHEVDAGAWEARERHGGKVLKIHSGTRMHILKENGVSRRDIQFYQKCATIIRNRRKLSVQRVQWDRLDEAIERMCRALLCRFAHVEVSYPKQQLYQSSNSNRSSKIAVEITNEEDDAASCETKFSKRHSCPHFGVVALEMDEPNCENALMYNNNFTNIFRRVSKNCQTPPSMEDSRHASVRRAEIFRASFQEYATSRHSGVVTLTSIAEAVAEIKKETIPDESGHTFGVDSSCNTIDNDRFSSEFR